MTPGDALDLADYRRRVTEMYARVRSTDDPAVAWETWVEARDGLFRTHPQSALDAEARLEFQGLRYWAYDPAFRTTGRLVNADAATFDVAHSGTGHTRFVRLGRLEFELGSQQLGLDAFWLDAYGGGLFVPFADATNGSDTYGGGRYLLDTVKGADLGGSADAVILDFNFAYHPSCVHSPQWSCPLAPPGNRLDVPVTAGERLGAAPASVG